MEPVKTNTGSKSFLNKTWKRCRSFPHNRSSRGHVGFVPVYVGPDKQRFVVKTKYVNHPLFTMLLEDAETEYGYSSDGPIWLPCDVDLFHNLLAEMEAKEVEPHGRSFIYGSCSPFNPYQKAKVYGYHEALTSIRI